MAENDIEGSIIEIGADLDITSGIKVNSINADSYALWPKWIKKSFVNRIKLLEISDLVREWMLQGYPDAEVARRIQDHGHLLEYPVSHVSDLCTHYRHTIPKMDFVYRHIPSFAAKAERKLSEQINVMEEAAFALKATRGRVERSLEFENTMPAPIPEYDSIHELYARRINDFHSKQKDYGLIQNQLSPGSRVIAQGFDPAKIYTRPGVAEVMKDPARRMKVLGAIERALSIGNKIADQMDQINNPEPYIEKETNEVIVGPEIDLSGIDTVSGAEE